MNFISLTLQGFRSFHDKTAFRFGTQGLVQVLGVNQVEPELNSNGSGKSSLFESLHWVLFGKTSCNLRAGDVAAWASTKRCEVSLELEDDKHKYLVRRAWNPNELMLTIDAGTRSVDQETLERTLGYTPETFLYSVFHAQFLDNFATLTPARQLEIYTAALRLDTWEELSDKAAALAKPIKESINGKEKEVARAKGYLASARESLEAEQDKEIVWHRERWCDILEVTDELEALFRIEKQLLVEKKNAVDAPADAATKKLQTQIDDEEERVQLLDQQLAVKKSKLLDLKSSVTKFKKGVCPTCGQKIEKHKLSDWETDVETSTTEISEAIAKRQEKFNEITSLRSKLRKEQATYQVANSKIIERAAEIKEKLNSTSKAISDKAMDRVDIARRKCPHDTESIEESIARYVEQLREQQTELSAERDRIAALEFWVKSFRDIRLSLIDSSLRQFEAVSNNALALLGLHNWSIEFAIESETKAGNLRRGFTCNVISPYNENRVPFLSWSGGESQRLSLAIAVGLSDLIRDFVGVRGSIEIWDEPCRGLSDEGVEGVLKMLSERAEQNNIEIFLIEHRLIQFGGFKRVIKVLKGANGSTFEEST